MNIKKLLPKFIFILALAASVQAATISPSQVPLFQATITEPNVMLLVDTSGSMDFLVSNAAFYDPGYNATTSTPGSWDYCSNTNKSNVCSAWTTYPADSSLPSAKKSSCATDYGLYRKGTSTYCFKLGTISDLNTLNYTTKYLRWLFDTKGTSSSADLTPFLYPLDPTKRITIAKSAIQTILTKKGIRYGLARFSETSGVGGAIIKSCDSSASHITDIQTEVNNLSATGSTPLSEAYYEVTRFFRSMSSYYKSSTNKVISCSSGSCTTNYTSPMQSACQKNIIIAITDGYPTNDISFPTDDPADVADTTKSLPNWDNIITADTLKAGGSCTDPEDVIFKPYSDGLGYQLTPNTHNCATSAGNETHSLFLDDLSKFAADLDIKPDTEKDINNVFYTDKQPISTYTIGLTVNNQMLADAAKYGSGTYSFATDSASLNNSLSNIIDTIAKKTGSASAVTTNSTRLEGGTQIFQARFVGKEWSGELVAYPIISSTTASENGSVSTTPAWSTSTNTNAFEAYDDRKIFTRNDAGNGISFLFSNLSTAQKATFNTNPDTNAVDTVGPARLNFLRGNALYDGSTSGGFTFRSRGFGPTGIRLILGDIINSDPFFLGSSSDYGYKNLPSIIVNKDGDSINTGATTYKAFIETNKLNDADDTFKNSLFVGSNDGMMHAFNAEDGTELFAYIPSELIDRLPLLTSPSYENNHKYFVDGSPWAGHVFIGATELTKTWKSVVVGTLGVGGKSVYALNVSDPTNFSASDVMWERKDLNLGYMINNPTIVPLANGEWGVLVANGIGNGTNKAQLLVLNVKDGSLIHTFDTNPTNLTYAANNPAALGDANNPNGLTSAVGAKSEDNVVRTVYGGDALGNLWRFDLSDRDPANWGVAYNSKPVFKATDTSGNLQIITGSLDIGRNSSGGYLIFFGTGKYLESSDAVIGASPQTQSFYAIRDIDTGLATDTSWTTITRASLLQQSISEVDLTKVNDQGEYVGRTVSSVEITATHNGWYIDLLPSSGTAQGERIVETPTLRNDRVIFVTLIPSSVPCKAGGTSWLMEVNAQSGGLLLYPIFDTNGDGVINSSDIPTAGVSDDSILSPPSIISTGDKEMKYMSSSSGAVKKVDEASTDTGRLSWKQIR